MRVFVAGATGVLGAPLVPRLVSLGHSVVGLTRSAHKAALLREMGAEPTVADALDAAAVDRAVREASPEVIIHLLTALPKSGPLRYRDFDATNAVRTAGTRNLLEAARTAGVRRFLAESMIFVYGYGDHGTAPVTEEHLPSMEHLARGLRRAVDAMRTMEALVRASSRATRMEGVILRFGALYGLDASAGMEAALRAGRLPLVGGGEGVASWVHTSDAVSAILAALERGRSGEVYNVVDDAPVSHRDFFGTMAEVLGAPAPRTMPRWLARLVVPSAAAFFDARLPVSNAKARRELAWVPTARSYREGLRMPSNAPPEPAGEAPSPGRLSTATR